MYPIMLDLSGKTVIIIGGGKIALRKTKSLLQAKAKVTIVAPDILPDFNELLGVRQINAPYDKKYLISAQLIFACTDSKIVNQQVVNDASANQWVNDCSQKENSDFFNMATIEQADYLIALSYYGEDPSALKAKKAELRKLLE